VEGVPIKVCVAGREEVVLVRRLTYWMDRL